jgi:hypothetical protein
LSFTSKLRFAFDSFRAALSCTPEKTRVPH